MPRHEQEIGPLLAQVRGRFRDVRGDVLRPRRRFQQAAVLDAGAAAGKEASGADAEEPAQQRPRAQAERRSRDGFIALGERDDLGRARRGGGSLPRPGVPGERGRLAGAMCHEWNSLPSHINSGASDAGARRTTHDSRAITMSDAMGRHPPFKSVERREPWLSNLQPANAAEPRGAGQVVESLADCQARKSAPRFVGVMRQDAPKPRLTQSASSLHCPQWTPCGGLPQRVLPPAERKQRQEPLHGME